MVGLSEVLSKHTHHALTPSIIGPEVIVPLAFTIGNKNPMNSSIWQYGLWSFQTVGTKLERFLPKNQHTQRKLLNFENWISGGLRSFQKSEF